MSDIYNIYAKLSPLDRILFLEWVYANDSHKYDYAKLTPNQRKFSDATAKRPE